MESVNARLAAADRQHLQLEPLVVLPVQIQSPRMADASLVPEKQLLLAVLEEAITTFQRHIADTGRRGRRLFHEAETWLLSEEREWPCSFHNICDALGLDVGYLRDGLTRWRDERQRDPASSLPFRPRFRRLHGSRTRTVRRPVGLSRSTSSGRPSPAER